jgi:MFS family permease
MTNMVKPFSDEDMLRGAPETSVIQRVPASKRGGWVLIATILGSSMAFIDGTVVNVALPVLQLDLKAAAADVQWVVEAYALFLAALILVGGSLGDHFGRRRIFALGVSLFAVASVLCGLAPTIALLIVARAIQGIGGALLVPGSLASSVLRSRTSSVDERLGPGRASRLSPQSLVRCWGAGWLHTLPGAGSFLSMCR